MRTLSVVLAGGIALAVFAGPRALEVKAQQKDLVLVERIQDLNLTDQQESRIADIRKEFRPKVQDAAKDLAGIVKEEVDKVRAVLTAPQKEKLQALREERTERRAEGLAQTFAHVEQVDLTDGEIAKIGEIRKEFRPKLEASLRKMEDLLTEQQRQARADGLKAGKTRREVIAALNLTDDQKAKVEMICKEVGTLVQDELEKVRDVLSAEQQAKLTDLKEERRDRIRDHMAARIGNLKDLNLTDDQKGRIGEIRQEFRPKVHEAGNKLRSTVKEEVEAIAAVMKG